MGDGGTLDANATGTGWLDGVTPALAHDWPVQVYWVCGKADGFDMQVFWDDNIAKDQGLVTVFIVTPPLVYVVGEPIPHTPASVAKRVDSKGSLLLRSTGIPGSFRRWMVRDRDGGSS